jgi:hypothetical protein
VNATGQVCGSFLWETKRTKNFADSWLAKLRADQRSAGADVAIIVSKALPKGIDTFGFIDGVWITNISCVVPLAIALRQKLIELAGATQIRAGQATKMELIYQHLTGPKFRHRVEAIVETFSDMQADLNRERNTLTRQLAKREAQIQGIMESIAGMYGDLQGIAGKAFEEIEGLAIPLLAPPKPKRESAVSIDPKPPQSMKRVSGGLRTNRMRRPPRSTRRLPEQKRLR